MEILAMCINSTSVQPDFWFRMQSPPHGHLFIRFRSKAIVRTNDGFKAAKPGDFILYHRDELMEYGSKNNVFIHDYIRFHLQPDEELLFNVPTSRLFTFPMSSKLDDIIRMIAVEFHGVSSSREQSLDLLGRLFLLNMTDIVNNQQEHLIPSHRYHDLLDLRIEMLTAPQKEWTVEKMADIVNMSPSYFQGLYKKIFGISCMNDIISSRVKLAETMLLSSDKTETEIAELCGYNSFEHFIRQFKKYTGRTPSQYKLKNR